MGIISEVIGSISSENFNTSISGFQNYGAISILGVIPSIIYIIAMYIPYTRIKEGKLIPTIITLDGSTVQIPRVCPNCSRQIPLDSALCPYCGKDFRE